MSKVIIMCTYSWSRASKGVSKIHHMYLLMVMCHKINELTCSVCNTLGLLAPAVIIPATLPGSAYPCAGTRGLAVQWQHSDKSRFVQSLHVSHKLLMQRVKGMTAFNVIMSSLQECLHKHCQLARSVRTVFYVHKIQRCLVSCCCKFSIPMIHI